MKRLTLLSAVLAISAACLAQDVKPVTHYGFQMTASVASSWSFTNDNAYPFRFSDMSFNSSVANTTVVQRVHPYRVSQIVGWVTTTNAMGESESNYYAQVTNTVVIYATNTILSVTNAGSDVYTSGDIKQLWIHSGDVIRWTWSDTSTNLLIFNATR
jgi:hypothetical protein